jgi:hypothetical protein
VAELAADARAIPGDDGQRSTVTDLVDAAGQVRLDPSTTLHDAGLRRGSAMAGYQTTVGATNPRARRGPVRASNQPAVAAHPAVRMFADGQVSTLYELELYSRASTAAPRNPEIQHRSPRLSSGGFPRKPLRCSVTEAFHQHLAELRQRPARERHHARHRLGDLADGYKPAELGQLCQTIIDIAFRNHAPDIDGEVGADGRSVTRQRVDVEAGGAGPPAALTWAVGPTGPGHF